jgi:hypothetical protein
MMVAFSSRRPKLRTGIVSVGIQVSAGLQSRERRWPRVFVFAIERAGHNPRSACLRGAPRPGEDIVEERAIRRPMQEILVETSRRHLEGVLSRWTKSALGLLEQLEILDGILGTLIGPESRRRLCFSKDDSADDQAEDASEDETGTSKEGARFFQSGGQHGLLKTLTEAWNAVTTQRSPRRAMVAVNRVLNGRSLPSVRRK